MKENNNDIKRQYQGFLNTPLLWESELCGLSQFQLTSSNNQQFTSALPGKLRLGKRVERFVSEAIKSDPNIEILSENHQVQREKLTLGELDCILLRKEIPIHLEIIYKFYLVDTSVGTTEIEHCIGPNRKDNLLKKLTKLKEKQLPLLYAPETKPLLDQLGLNMEAIVQQVYFKAQLFLPLKETIKLKQLNRECVQGFYCNFEELQGFSDCKFDIPTKANWLKEAETQTNWMDFDSFREKINHLLAEEKSPLCWMKRPNGQLEKCFVVWW